MPEEPIDVKWFLGPDGPVAKSMDQFEHRDEQIEMSATIAEALSESQHLMIEAGTGVGKSFSYLAAAISHALAEKKQVILSTYTITLQEQLIYKDIPFLQEICDQEFTAVLAKGRGNYLCMRRLKQAQERQGDLFTHSEHFEMLEEIYHWALQTKDGSLSDLPFTPPHAVWEMVCSDNSTCQGKVCNRQSECFYQQARRKLYKADLIIVNHALLFTDLALRLEGGAILPNPKYIILDEAHNIESIAGKHFGVRVSNSQIYFLLNRIYNPKTNKGVLAGQNHPTAFDLLNQIHLASDQFFGQLQRFHEDQQNKRLNGRVTQPQLFTNSLADPLKQLSKSLADISKNQEREQDQIEIMAFAQRAFAFANNIELFVTQALEDNVYWVESKRRRQQTLTTLCASPIHIGPSLQKALFEPSESVILTSATLSTQSEQSNESGFNFYRSRLGLEDVHGVALGSPFDYPNQATIYLESYMPDPTQKEAFMDHACTAVKKYLQQTQGNALILFTNYFQLHQMADRLQEFCDQQDFPLLQQGKEMNRSVLMDHFRHEPNSVLLGTESFWQGIDVPGDQLGNVIIVKLPFSVPDEPLLQARLEQIRKTGGNPFRDYQLPEAIIKFKQGFGRLIRTKNDRGIVVILDSRLTSKSYGNLFLNALPNCPIEIVRDP